MFNSTGSPTVNQVTVRVNSGANGGGMYFYTTSSDTTPRKITYSLGTSIPYNLTGHFFGYVSGQMTWAEAKAAASRRAYFGNTGYPETINDLGENLFANTKINGQGTWIGGSDAAVEGHWK